MRDQLRNYAMVFNQRTDTASRTFIIALVPLTALLTSVLVFWRIRSVVQPLVFATHWSAVMVLLTLVAGWLMALVYRQGWVMGSAHMGELVFTLLVLVPLAVWKLPALRRAFDLAWPAAAIIGLAMVAFWSLFVLQLYRALLFFAVFWTG